jgi:hypothetical protein
MPTFRELGLSEPLLEALDHLGYQDPTPIQEQAIPALLEGRDVIGQAQTGTSLSIQRTLRCRPSSSRRRASSASR